METVQMIYCENVDRNPENPVIDMRVWNLFEEGKILLVATHKALVEVASKDEIGQLIAVVGKKEYVDMAVGYQAELHGETFGVPVTM